MRILVWFRRDLRVADNMALAQAAGDGDEVIGLYVLTAAQWKQHDDSPSKVHFWLRNLKCLSESLAALNIPLVVKQVDDFDQSVACTRDAADQLHCDAIYFNREYEVNERRRDAKLQEICEQASQINVRGFDDRVIVPPGRIKTKDGRPYSVFTPYRKVWDQTIDDFAKVQPAPKQQKPIEVAPSDIPEVVEGFGFDGSREDLWVAGEPEAQRRLTHLVAKVDDYSPNRDFPAINGTSLLSPYLAAGVISPRQCLAAITAANQRENSGAITWISELAWRDFYHDVMISAPRVSRHQPFKPSTRAVQWRTDHDEFDAWCEGRTGYPIVDAGMRQLNQTHWMHNRLRMVTAMFLTKNLLIDWRWGERYFMQQLIDGDLAANNGGWQWSASTGTDSVPYFRIFNPFSQSKRFDTDGSYIKRFCPELAPIPSAALHDPNKLSAAIAKAGVDYPDYVVNYSDSRTRALAEFKRVAAL